MYVCHRILHELTHSFPSRRASDLACRDNDFRACQRRGPIRRTSRASPLPSKAAWRPPPRAVAARGRGARSEEHTSELQSLIGNSYAVFCLQKKIDLINITKLQSLTYKTISALYT